MVACKQKHFVPSVPLFIVGWESMLLCLILFYGASLYVVVDSLEFRKSSDLSFGLLDGCPGQLSGAASILLFHLKTKIFSVAIMEKI